MKKIKFKITIFIFIICLLNGCARKQSHIVDENTYHYETDFATLKNSMATSSAVIDSDKGVLLFPSF